MLVDECAPPLGDFQLVDAAFVDERLADRGFAGGWVLLEAHFASSDHPPVGGRCGSTHIPGAIQVHPSYLEVGTDRSRYYPHYTHPSDGDLLPDRELVRALQRLGLAPETPVVVYGSEPDGTMAAARLVWALMYAGIGTVRLLDGGLGAWLAYGGATCPRIRSATAIGRDDSRVPASTSRWKVRSELVVTTEAVRGIVHGGGTATDRLIDVRGTGEWDGSSPYHYPFFSKAGHIPTAWFQGDWDNLMDRSTHKLAPALDGISRRWRKQGILDPGVAAGETCLIFYCGTGWRSSVAFLVARLLGLRAKNYDSGFYGWSWDAENEIAVEPTG